ncbi:glycosyltransferase family 2 protein [Sphingomonas guangdongensis]|uniref:glycosyltransferase family 2 protein n=1 Tax=Sphingomonas guangdongensis TaxID=1141890 RepID=UPI002481BA39|nr:glycosyltransferase family 2 protein [Sphingomonas guangdongensis]
MCTYRRPGVAATLQSLAAQVLPTGVSMRVIVADNDDEPSARERVLAAGAGLTLHYVHAPARNISVARNACLEAATAPAIAFLDDDEVAPPTWLRALLTTMEQTGAPIVLGPVRAQYGDDLPAWLKAADLHSTRPAIRRDGTIDTGYSCNVLFRRDILNGLRFDPARGVTGGEDDAFFSQLYRRGHRIAFAADAMLEEVVPPHRAQLRWLLRRAFRNGQTYASIRLAAGDWRIALATRAGAKGATCGAAAAANVWSGPRWRRALVRGALHAGTVARVLGKRDLRLYS